jgi:hypothetical protein
VCFSALDAYAMSLLLARDEKLKTHSFRGNNSIIALIAEELGEHTYLSAESHKTHHSSYTMNLSTHSMTSNGSGGGGDSPTSRMYKRIASLNSGRSRTSSNAVAPEETTQIEDDPSLKLTLPRSKQGSSAYGPYPSNPDRVTSFSEPIDGFSDKL